MTGQIVRYRMDLAREVAEGDYGFEWDSDMRDWVLFAANWYRDELKRREEERKKNEKRFGGKAEELVGRES